MMLLYSSMLYAIPPPVPPSVKAGRMMSGNRPIFSWNCACQPQNAISRLIYWWLLYYMHRNSPNAAGHLRVSAG